MGETSNVLGERLHEGLVVQGRFRLEAPLGEGGMGIVWSSLHLLTRRRVALKFLKVSDVASVRRFLREARIAGTLAHRNIAPVHDVLQLEDGTPVMVMDLLLGEPLSRKLAREGSFSVAALVAVMQPVVAAVAAAHDKGVVHRDLKPENVFLESPPENSGEASQETSVKVLDFGIAKVIEPSAGDPAGLTQSGAVLGTPHYMAPEQVFGDRTVDHRADIWSLGVIFYELLTGRRPLDGDNFGQVFKAIALDEIVAIDSIAPSIPAPLAALVTRMLSRDRAARPPLVEIDRVLSSCAKTASHERLATPLPRVSLSTLGATSSPLVRPTRGRRSWVAIGAIGFWICGLVVVGVTMNRSAAPSSSTEHSAAIVTSSSASTASPSVASAIVSSAPSTMNDVVPSTLPSAKPLPIMGKPKLSLATPAPSVSASVAISSSGPTTKLPGGVHAESPY